MTKQSTTISVLFLAALAQPAATSGQMVRGTLVERASGMPIEGAAIVALDLQNHRLGWTFTDAAGRFFFRFQTGGRFMLRADRIGHASTLSDELHVGMGDTLVYRMEAAVEAVELDALMVEGSTRGCEIRPDEGLATARVWEEARKALEAAAQTTRRGTYRFLIQSFDRHLDERGRRVLSETSEVVQRLQPRPFRSLKASQLLEDGFMQPDGDGWIYYAPDADVLLSDEFLDSHCFRLHEGRGGNAGLLALEFEPTKDREVTEISGTFWIDPESAELQHLEYEYENLGFVVGRAPIGGTVGFAGLPNGTWFVQSWSIRMARLGQSREHERSALGIPGMPRIHSLAQVVGVHETGALVLQVHDRFDNLVLESDAGTVTGTVLWEEDNLPVAGAVVTMESSSADATTADDGSFRLGSLGDGSYELVVTHPTLTEIGHRGESATVQAVSGQVASVRIAIPSKERVLEDVCVGPGPDHGGIVAGWVRHSETGEPIRDATVRVSVTRYTIIRGQAIVARESGVEALTREDGFFIYCGTGDARVVDIEIDAQGMESWIGFAELSGEAPIAHVSARLVPKRREH